MFQLAWRVNKYLTAISWQKDIWMDVDHLSGTYVPLSRSHWQIQGGTGQLPPNPISLPIFINKLCFSRFSVPPKPSVWIQPCMQSTCSAELRYTAATDLNAKRLPLSGRLSYNGTTENVCSKLTVSGDFWLWLPSLCRGREAHSATSQCVSREFLGSDPSSVKLAFKWWNYHSVFFGGVCNKSTVFKDLCTCILSE